MSDIIAENQTEAVLSVLDRGEADNATRDKVSAALLRSQTKVLYELGKIQDNLWTLNRLESFIDKRHEALCSKCPHRTGSFAKKDGGMVLAAPLVRVPAVLCAHTRPRVGGHIHQDRGGGRGRDPRRGRVYGHWRREMTKAVVVAAVLLAAVAGCRSRTDVPSGDAYPRHERWWR